MGLDNILATAVHSLMLYVTFYRNTVFVVVNCTYMLMPVSLYKCCLQFSVHQECFVTLVGRAQWSGRLLMHNSYRHSCTHCRYAKGAGLSCRVGFELACAHCTAREGDAVERSASGGGGLPLCSAVVRW